jgi:flagellum-specific peptidoglycan hydrolase FlgJ
MTMQETFLQKAYQAAASAGHIFPAHAACEAALESGWGLSQLATEANNLFGQKQAHPPLRGTETISLPTREYLHGAWTTILANWIKFPDWPSCFAQRMRLLKGLSASYPHYAAALSAKTGEEFIQEVSRSWSTDPQRAEKVLSVYAHYQAVFACNGPR